MTRSSGIKLGALVVVMAAAAACGGSSKSSGPGPTASRPTVTSPTTLAPSQYRADVDNPWFPLEPGSVRIYTGTSDGKPVREVFTVTRETKRIAGVDTRVVSDKVYVDGHLEESTLDYYTQDEAGNVWYFGEDTQTLDEQGNVTGTEGTWQAGVDGAEPGIFMAAEPAVGQVFRQEYLEGEAEDHFKVLSLSVQVSVPYGTFRDAMQTEEWTPVEPDLLEHKFYVKGIGQVREVSVRGGSEELVLSELRRP